MFHRLTSTAAGTALAAGLLAGLAPAAGAQHAAPAVSVAATTSSSATVPLAAPSGRRGSAPVPVVMSGRRGSAPTPAVLLVKPAQPMTAVPAASGEFDPLHQWDATPWKWVMKDLPLNTVVRAA